LPKILFSLANTTAICFFACERFLKCLYLFVFQLIVLLDPYFQNVYTCSQQVEIVLAFCFLKQLSDFRSCFTCFRWRWNLPVIVQILVIKTACIY